MVPLHFFSQNLHFTVSLFAALVTFAVFVLYFDAWTGRREPKDLWKWLGFCLLSLGFLIHATTIEGAVLGSSLVGGWAGEASFVLRLLGYLGIMLGQILDPLQPVPKLSGAKPKPEPPVEEPKPAEPAVSPPPVSVTVQPPRASKKKPRKAAAIMAMGLTLRLLPAAGALLVSFLYLRRSTKGMERHVRPVAIAFGILGLSELLGLADMWRDTTNPLIYQLVAPFGLIWFAEQLALAIGAIVLGRWVWRYLLDRFFSQLFLIFTAMTMAIFLIVTVSFTFLLVRNVQQGALTDLETTSRVLQYAIDSKQAQTKMAAEVVAKDPEIISKLAAKDHNGLVALAATALTDRQLSRLAVISDSGQVMVRAEDPERWGDSLSDDSLVNRALVGTAGVTLTSYSGVVAPSLVFEAAIPVRDSRGQLIGVIKSGLTADNGFVDGIKNSTGLDSALYSGNVRAAATFKAPDGKSRILGIKEDHAEVVKTVIENAKTYAGPLRILNRDYLAVYAPMYDINNDVAGMLFIGQPQSTILTLAGKSIEFTFLVAVLLLLLMLLPAYLVAHYLADELKAL